MRLYNLSQMISVLTVKIIDLSDAKALVIVECSDMQELIIGKARETFSHFPRHNFTGKQPRWARQST